MFTDLFKLQKKAVTVFSSSDKDSPILTSDAGSLKTVLKACLVTGYGDKAGLGWQMKFETENQLGAVFVSSDPTSAGFHLKIANNDATALLSVYRTMSDFDTGKNAMIENRNYKTQASEWRLIGHGKAFILLINGIVGRNGDTKCAYPIIFGDLPAAQQNIISACVFWTASTNKVSNYYQGIGGVQSTLFVNPDGYNQHSDSKRHESALCHPVLVSVGSGGHHITQACCRFMHHSEFKSSLLYEPILLCLPDGSWSFLPMCMPLSAKTPQGNFAMIAPNLMLARTGWYQEGDNNNDCAVPTDHWWA